VNGLAGQALSAVLGLASVTATLLISHRHRSGWWLYAALQCAWIPYDVETGQLGLLIITAAAVPAAWHGIRHRERVHQQRDPGGS
jgi:hypothetical protein